MHKHRIRVTGLAIRGDEVLLVEQQSPHTGIRRWSTPGGGMELTDTDMFRAVEREMLEETNLQVKAERICFINEFYHTATDTLMVDIWILCHPVGDTWGEASLERVRADDYITNIAWWSKDTFLTPGRLANKPLYSLDFWDNLHAPAGPVRFLGRWEG
jgi:8-oxo-dGTP pyrophosphatase MutT (NUDIX family)